MTDAWTRHCPFFCTVALLVALPLCATAEPVTASENRTFDALVEASTVETGFAAGAPIALPIPLSDPTFAVRRSKVSNAELFCY